ncbi:MAG: AAC(3) family N-acetyltransferase [Erysipelotrichaceae bacterium]|nr:AAC(3) family N-acetyltransferase [Erysipelotrichaceae bacterium]
MEAIHTVVTRNDIMQGLALLGLEEGMVVEVHSSLSSFGYVVGGAQTVVDALIDIVGRTGTILMPMQCSDNTEPANWINPPIDPELNPVVRKNMPAFNVYNTEAVNMGAIVENFRRREGVVFSNHPTSAFCARGRYAKLLTNRHSLHFGLSGESPVSRLYELKGSVLLLGVGYDNCTCMHLAEYLAECRPIIVNGSAISVEGRQTWKKYLDLDIDSDIFKQIGQVLEGKGLVSHMKIGNCDAILFNATQAVDEAVRYLDAQCIYNLYR